MVLVIPASDYDYDSDDARPYHGPSKIVVKGAGLSAVDGVYVRDRAFDDASQFSRKAAYGGKSCKFSIFRCYLSNNTKAWFISIVPTEHPPGTRDDIDFYTVPATETGRFPPLHGWKKADGSLDPPPTLLFQDD